MSPEERIIMSKMRAIVVDPGTAGRLVLDQVDQPTPAPSQALVRVRAVSLNRGEVRRALTAQEHYVPGWDLAGIVERAAADGSGPQAGTRVVGLVNPGAWAEYVAVPTNALAPLPDGVSFSQAATLPVAGLTALYSVRRGGSLLARRVLVTGASGGVGVFAVELAHLSGGTVVGLTHHAEYEPVVRQAGASSVVVGDDISGASGAEPLGPYHLILDGVGGHVLASAAMLLAAKGLFITYAAPAGPEITFNSRVLSQASGVALTGFFIFRELPAEPASQGLADLANLVAEGRLHPRVEVEAPWGEVAQVARRLIDRQFPGKAVLLVG
jgi:NADPH:quinone reductase